MAETFTLETYLKELEYLVNFDSGSYLPEGTAKVADFFRKKFEDAGWSVESISVSEKIGPCLKITNCKEGPYDVLLLGHMDTVFPKGTAAERPYRIDEKGIIFGAGVSDMKGCLLSAYYALIGLKSQGKLSKAKICFLMNSDEEIGSIYSRKLIEETAKNSRHALIVESARKNGALVNQRSGIGMYNFSAHGVAAHAGVNPQDGGSAILALSHVVVKLHELCNYSIGTSVNVGTISGGSGRNVVPDHAECAVDVRFIEQSEIERLQKNIETIANTNIVDKATIAYTGQVNRPPMKPTEKTLELCAALSKLGTDLGVPFDWAQTGGGSDGNFTAAVGVPTFDGIGPVGGGAHGIGEFLDSTTVEPRLRLTMAIIEYLSAQ